MCPNPPPLSPKKKVLKKLFFFFCKFSVIDRITIRFVGETPHSQSKQSFFGVRPCHHHYDDDEGSTPSRTHVAFPQEGGIASPHPHKFFLLEFMNHAVSWRSCRACGNYSHLHAFFCTRESQSKDAQESMASSNQASGMCRYRGRERNSLGHTWSPGWTLLRETSTEKLLHEPRRQHRRDHGLGVFQYNCESLRAPDRLYELMTQA